MNVVDLGSGPPVVVVPGAQGRWEWMRPGVDALAKECRVITFSLADEPTCGAAFDPARGFDSYVDQIRDAMDAARVQSAVIAGVSYGGLVAAAFAARYPARVRALLLVSAIPPGWTPDARARFYLRAPRLLFPLFVAASLRLYREIASASDGVLQSVGAAARHALNVLAHMLSPARVARRVTFLRQAQLETELRRLRLPTLVVTGDAGLDRVVPVHLTEQYLRMWPHAERATISRTGHLGLITRPEVFAGIVAPFVIRHTAEDASGQEKKVG